MPWQSGAGKLSSVWKRNWLRAEPACPLLRKPLLLQIQRNLSVNFCLHLRRKKAGEEAGFGSLRKI